MESEPSERVRELFFAVLDLPRQERAVFLDARCAGDAGLVHIDFTTPHQNRKRHSRLSNVFKGFDTSRLIHQRVTEQ